MCYRLILTNIRTYVSCIPIQSINTHKFGPSCPFILPKQETIEFPGISLVYGSPGNNGGIPGGWGGGGGPTKPG